MSPHKHYHQHKVNETKMRSLLKAITGRTIEITIGGITFGIVLTILKFPNPFVVGFGLNLLEETICFLTTFFTERVWNKISWGREVEDIENAST